MHSTFTPSLHLVPFCLLHSVQDVYTWFITPYMYAKVVLHVCVCFSCHRLASLIRDMI